MFSFASKAFFAVAAIAGGFAFVYTFGTNDLSALVILYGAVGVAVFLGLTALAATGPGDRLTALVGTQDPRANRAPRQSAAPVLLAIAGGCAVGGAAVGAVAFVAAAIIAGLAGMDWFVSTWRESPLYLPKLTSRVSDRFSLPIGLPLAAIGLIAISVISLSRILLAVSKNAATSIALAAAIVIVIVGVVAAMRPRIDRRVVIALGAIATVAVLGLGVVGIAMGERDFHHAPEGTEHSEEGGGGGAGEGGAGAGKSASAGTEKAEKAPKAASATEEH